MDGVADGSRRDREQGGVYGGDHGALRGDVVYEVTLLDRYDSEAVRCDGVAGVGPGVHQPGDGG
jgi:hypothetical protein